VTIEDWQRTTLADVVTFYTGGDPFLKSEYRPNGIPVLAKGDVKPFGRLEHSGRFVPVEVVQDRGYRLTEPGDYLLTTRDLTQAADFLGLLAPVPAGTRFLVNQGANIVRFSPKVDARFIVYWCNGPMYRHYVKGHYVGSTQIHLRKGDFLDAPLILPPLPEQRAIAEVLGAFDDKMEVNSRVQMAAEAVARAEVARAQAREGSLGRLDSVVERVSEIVQPSDLSSDTMYVGLDDMPQGSILLKGHETAEGLASAKASFQARDVLFGRLRPYFKKVAVAPQRGVCSTDILVLRAKADDWTVAAAICASDEVIDYASAGSEGTRMPRVSWDYLGRCQVLMPSRDDRMALQTAISPLLELGMALTEESNQLAVLRDTLLPKLLSGELRVREAERAAKEAV
jgi:type I restriction enzyme S subunit